MFFGKKSKKEVKCENCSSKVSKDFRFCPHCGDSLADPSEEARDFGLLGRTNSIQRNPEMPPQGFGISERMISSVFNSLIKNLDKQFKNMDKDFGKAEVRSIPNGIKIRIGQLEQPRREQKPKSGAKRELTEEQIDRMSKLPRAAAKTSVKRLSDKIVYELSTPGVESPQDVFVSKLESGYEIKALGSKKVYVNSIPLELPLNKVSILNNKLLVEFNHDEE